MFTRSFMKQNIISFAIVLYIIVYLILNQVKPNFLYTKSGILRPFGLNYKNKTILPIWLISIFIAILSYISLLYYITYPRIVY
jgi:hypothetical protein